MERPLQFGGFPTWNAPFNSEDGTPESMDMECFQSMSPFSSNMERPLHSSFQTGSDYLDNFILDLVVGDLDSFAESLLYLCHRKTIITVFYWHFCQNWVKSVVCCCCFYSVSSVTKRKMP